MRAAVIAAYGQPPEVRDRPDPTPGPGQTLIENRAAALNPVDLKIASGSYYLGAPPPPYVAGAEGVGSRRYRRDSQARHAGGMRQGRMRQGRPAGRSRT